MIDYTIFYKDQLSFDSDWTEHWDVFLSAYVPADRTHAVFSKARAAHKLWLIFQEYQYANSELPSGAQFACTADNEVDFVSSLWATFPPGAEKARICIDISGFIRPYLMFLIKWLFEKGVRKFDAIYAEPAQYIKREHTEFSGGAVSRVRQVNGFEGNHDINIDNDLLVFGSGYEDQLVRQVAEAKAKARKLQLMGFPSLRADMYQENVLRMQRAEDSLGNCIYEGHNAFFAPAHDPFVAASQLSRVVTELNGRKRITNLYLCPLSTKAHVLGFVLYYLWERRSTPTSIIFPFEARYSKHVSKGLGRLWKYTVELPSK